MFTFFSKAAQSNRSAIRHHAPSPDEQDLTRQLDRIRSYYFARGNAELKPTVRRLMTYRKLVELPQMTPQLAQVVLRQWDELATAA
jgi:hypothetical protein